MLWHEWDGWRRLSLFHRNPGDGVDGMKNNRVSRWGYLREYRFFLAGVKQFNILQAIQREP